MASAAERLRGLDWPRIEVWLVWLIALHSVGVGAFMLLFTRWCVWFGGWGEAAPLFFPRQAGVFHLVVATGYLLEFTRSRGVTLLVTTKTIAFVFLLAMTVVDRGPWIVPVSALTDGMMGLVVLYVHTKARRA